MQPTNDTPQRKTPKIDFRIVSIVLLVIIAVMFALWQPWANNTPDRTIQVTGNSIIKAEPDEFVFYPTYQSASQNKDKALADLTAKNNTIVEKLKAFGVQDKQIKTNADNYSTPSPSTDSTLYNPIAPADDSTYTLRLTITVDNKTLAQKVQDYLLTTSPVGTITPVPNFSNEKRKTIEAQARDGATKDARQKADQSAKNLGIKISGVKSAIDGSGFGVIPVGSGTAIENQIDSSMAKDPSIIVQPGENELSYSVTVTYYVK